MRFSRALQAALVAALFTAGCSGGNGGGGGNGGDPPIADAGDDASARIHRTYTLNGAQSEDPEGKDLEFTWSILSIPDGSAVTLSSGGLISNPTFVPDVVGLYVFGLTVSDGKKISLLDTVEIDVHLRIAVFADRNGDLAQDLEVSGEGDADDFPPYPESYIAGSARDALIMYDTRYRVPQLVAYHAFNGSQEILTSGTILDVRAHGDYVVWKEQRNGQIDLFARNLTTGAEQRLTNDTLDESLGNLTDGFVTWTRDNPPYSIDVFMAGLDSLGVIGVSPMDLDVVEDNAMTDGATIVYDKFGATSDVYAYDIAGQLTTPIATSTSNNEQAFGVSGDFVILGIDTGAGVSIWSQRISNAQRVEIAPTFSAVIDIDGDYVLVQDAGVLRAHRLSTGASITLAPTWDFYADVAGGVVAWTDEEAGTFDVFTKVLPSGATVNVTSDPAFQLRPSVLESGVAWDGQDAGDLIQSYYSPDGGTTVLLASEGKVYLSAVADSYDVALVGGLVDTTFAGDTIDALSAAGVPILALQRDGSSVGDYYNDQLMYSLTLDAADCGPAAVTVAAFPHPAIGDLPPGSYNVLERNLAGATYEARALDIGISPPLNWEVLASFAFNPNTCVLGDEPAIAAFTTTDGTMVIIDGVATDDISLWEPVRRQLLQSEIGWLVDTRAP